ncbi:MAG TPA: NAD(P)-dependent oxidoreductase [bacterium]|nr:NAD(P)-dependent oxidoreductase [bacterium]HOL47242.1 NAD(P)-dependent oxidoreductase [bacterium]HPQ19278.1 NAD(P)-dependent oxidoreductase [bacterium]
MNKQNQKVLVIGGSGFLGSATVEELYKRGYDVFVFDIRKPIRLLNENGIKYIEGDMLDFEKLDEAIKGKNIVYNFAGIVDLEEANKKPYATIKTNVIGNLNILECCVKNNIERYIFASTIYVYSEKGTFYRCSKQISELLIEAYHKKFNLNYTILRYGSIYGPDAPDNNWIKQILLQALNEKRIVRLGDGEEIREYIHLFDAAKASVDILEEKFKNDNIIITGLNSIKIKDLLLMIKEMLNNEITIEYKNGKYDEHYEITPYTFKPRYGKKYLVNPQIDLGQGILELLYELDKKKNCK